MATSTIITGHTITLKNIGSWYLAQDMPGTSRLKIKSIQVNPSATDDSVKIVDSRTGVATAGEIMKTLAASVYDIAREQFDGTWMAPAIATSSSVIGSAPGCSVIIEVA
jgi:hypothetical protein